MRRSKKLRCAYTFISTNKSRLANLESAYDYLFRKVMDIEMQKYGQNIKAV